MNTTPTGVAPVLAGAPRVRPAFMVAYRQGISYMRGSTVYTPSAFYVNSQPETRAPECGESYWRYLNMGEIWLKLQRLGECDVDFFFPPIKPMVAAPTCDEAPRAEWWQTGKVGSFGGKLYCVTADPGTTKTPTEAPDDWTCGASRDEIICHVLHALCGGSGGNVG